MDGNKKMGKSQKECQLVMDIKEGAQNLRKNRKICEYNWSTKYITVYAFSTENWKRTQEK